MKNLRAYTQTALALLLGRRCFLCGDTLAYGHLCEACILKLTYINIRGEKGNFIERLFWGVLPIERANAFVYYQPGFQIGQLLEGIKYHNQPQLAKELGRMMAMELLHTDFFQDIDAIQAVPLHPKREKKRGYNQSELIAEGVAEITGKPIVHLVRRIVNNTSQTLLQHNQRHDNVKGIFQAVEDDVNNTPHDTPSSVSSFPKEPRHLLLIDDVITTGATTISCGQALVSTYPNLRLSILSFAYAGNTHHGRILPQDLTLSDAEVSNEDFRESQYPPLA